MTANAAMEGRPAPAVTALQAPWLRSWHNRIALILLVLHAALAWLNRAFAAGLWHDESHYMLLARSLRRFRYEDYFLLGSPVHAQYPPGLAALFALLSLPFGEHPDVLIAALVLCSVGMLALLYDIIRRRSGSGIALAVLALCAFNPELLLFAGHPVSESAYLLLATLALWAVVREPAARPGAERAWLWPSVAILAALAAAMTRMVGVTVVAAIFLVWLLERRFRRAVVLAAAGSMAVGGWLLWSILAPEKLPGRSYVVDATLSQHGTEQSPYGLLGTLTRRIATNVPAYGLRHLPKDLPQPTLVSIVKRAAPASLSPDTVIAVDKVASLFLLVLAVVGSYVVWKQARVVILYLILYLALLAVWPFHLPRFLMPAVPIIVWVIMAGAVTLARQRLWLRPLPFAVAGGILAIALARDLSNLRDSARCDRRRARTSPACFGEVERGFFTAMDFIRRSTPDSAVFLTSTDAQVGYFANRRTVFAPAVARRDPATILDGLRARGVEYILLTPVRPPREQLVTLFQQKCGELEVMKEFPAITLALRLLPGGVRPRENACTAIDRYIKADIRSPLW
jgi:4-amino-4-deoxy-L-arabinose transferase-like glycosyltransferase